MIVSRLLATLTMAFFIALLAVTAIGVWYFGCMVKLYCSPGASQASVYAMMVVIIGHMTAGLGALLFGAFGLLAARGRQNFVWTRRICWAGVVSGGGALMLAGLLFVFGAAS